MPKAEVVEKRLTVRVVSGCSPSEVTRGRQLCANFPAFIPDRPAKGAIGKQLQRGKSPITRYSGAPICPRLPR